MLELSRHSSPHPKQGTDSLHPRSHNDEGPEVIDLELGVDRAVSALRRSLGMVVNLELRDGDTLCGVLGAVNSDVLILEHWDESSHASERRSLHRVGRSCAADSHSVVELSQPHRILRQTRVMNTAARLRGSTR